MTVKRSKRNKYQAHALIVDDNSVNQLVARSMLAKFGVTADVVNDGQCAVNILKDSAYDIVFMDCQMPVMDGYEATLYIRDSKNDVLNHKIPIVAMTASTMPEDKARCLECGMDDFIPKPIDIHKLDDVLAEWVAKVKEEEKITEEVLSVEQGKEIFNKEALSERLMGDSSLIAMITQAFLEDMPLQIEQLNKQLELNELDAVIKLFHKIKGAAANVGGTALMEIALELELTGKAGDIEKVREKAGQLEQQFELLKAMMLKVDA